MNVIELDNGGSTFFFFLEYAEFHTLGLGDMLNEDVPLGSNVTPVLVATPLLLNVKISELLAAT